MSNDQQSAAENLAAMQKTARERLDAQRREHQQRHDKMMTEMRKHQDHQEIPGGITFTIQQPRFAIGTPVTINATVQGVQYSADKVRYVFDLGPQAAIVDSDHVSPRLRLDGIGGA